MWTNWDLQLPLTGFGTLFATAAVVVLTSSYLLAWKRGHLGRREAILFMARMVCVILLLITLLRPEHIQTLTHNRKPELVVLTDDTGSMETLDVVDDTGNIISRQAWLEKAINSPLWQPLNQAYNVHHDQISNYSPNDTTPAAAAGTNLNSALKEVKNKYGDLRAVILLSDGDWNNGGTPVTAATNMRLEQIRIFPVSVGSNEYLPDLELLDVKAPAFGIFGEQVVISFRAQSRLKTDEHTRVELLSKGTVIAAKELFLPAGQVINDQLLWRATPEGEHELSLRIPINPTERLLDNNERTFRISVRRETLKVLVVDSEPRWEFRYLRNALMRDGGVDMDGLLLHPHLKVGGGRNYLSSFPADKDEISKYDVIFLGDIGLGPGELNEDQLELIKGVVRRQGSGLVFLPGKRGRQQTLLESPVAEMLPVEYDPALPHGTSFRASSRLLLTSQGSDHLLTMLAHSPAANRTLWKNLPGFYWNAGVRRAKPGSQVLATHSTQRNQWGRLPLLVTNSFGSGNVLFMGTDNAWRWRRGVEDRYHYRFWGQVVRWMAHPRHLSHDHGIRVSYSPENPRQGDTVTVQATVFDQNGYPLSKGTVLAKITNSESKTSAVTLTPVPGGWGVFTGNFQATTPGSYQLNISCEAAGLELNTSIHVASRTLERVGVPARTGTLQDLARITQGAYATTDDFQDLLETVRLLPRQKSIVERFPLWSQWWWGAIILALFTGVWVLRKLWGLV